MSDVSLGFIPETISVPFDRILPSRKMPTEITMSRKFKQIRASIEEVGLIEPLSVSPTTKKSENHLLLDGHVRLLALKDLGYADAPCLIAKDDESYTYNTRINRLSTIQEHYMIRRAVARGVPKERLARALSVDLSHVEKKITLLDGICSEAADLLKDRQFSADISRVIRKMKPTRQVECVELMVSADNVTVPVQEFISERERLYSVLPFRKFSVLTGSPGAGKSFELLKLVEFLGKSQERYLILSLTGKAVLRLKNNELGIKNVQAKTIDKFLNEIERQKGVKSIVNNLIIEEASMADLHKLAELLRAVDPLGSHFRRLILVGDENQLPPIGYGKPFADILDSLKSDSKVADRHFVSLTTNCRAELPEEFIGFTKIFANENKMGEQVLASFVENRGTSGVNLCTWTDKDELYQQIKDEFARLTDNPKDLSDGLDQVLGLSPGYKERPENIDNFQIMSPYRTGHSGVSGLNLLFQSEFRKSDQFTKKLGEMSFRVGDKLIHTKNEYVDNELFVSNGSFGIATGYNSIFFAEKDSASRFSDLRSPENLELAYAITVHKSQGSGFRQVFIVIPKRTGLLSRELMFTALTRTKERVTVFVESSDQQQTKKLLNQICSNSSIAGIRTTLALGPSKEFAYIPEEGVEVKSRVEYIIYRKLSEARAKIGGFEFKYENTYELKNGSFDFHPDFTIWLQDNKTVYWEHLGRVHDKSYIKMWDERRRIYESKGDFDKVLTTDEVNGISDEKIEAIIKGLLENNLKTEDPANRYSRTHFSLR